MMAGHTVDRRSVLLTSLATALGLAQGPALAADRARQAGTLDLTSPADNLLAYVKLRGSLVAQTVLKWNRGTLFGLVPGQTPKALLGYETLLLWHSMGRKISSLDQTSPLLRDFLAKEFPDFLTSPAPWAVNEDVWSRYLTREPT